jgi:hypothetical protein
VALPLNDKCKDVLSLEEFIETRIESVDDLRALLLFYHTPETEHTAVEVGGKLYLTPAVAETVLARLAGKGLLTGSGKPARYRFQPPSPELARLIEQLVELDRERPVTLIKMIYEKPKGIHAFAHAFKIKKRK